MPTTSTPDTTRPQAAVPGGLGELYAMKERLDRAFYDEATPPRDLAAISRRLLEISERIRSAQVEEAERVVDDEQPRDEAWTGV